MLERPIFNKQHNYRLVLTSDNIDLKHCGNCDHVILTAGEKNLDECSAMSGYGVPPGDRDVNSLRGLCDLHRRKNDK